ncbi:MAG: Rpn family recombination-promoting nuclease/putative transposase [Eubacteriales bacterium]|nr:Rpn family recombination-promoting nuclease/putative transposase [Eubacteriales bacterium]
MSQKLLNNNSDNSSGSDSYSGITSFDNRGRIVPLSEQTIKNSFLFGAVMLEGTNCKDLLQIILGREISKVNIIYEKSIVYHPEYKGIRMDVYAKGENNVRYNIEMQICTESTELRSRYYHSQMDMEILSAGKKYKELPETYVIFICNYDPLGYNKYVYTIDNRCRELPEYEYYDGRHTIFLSTRGNNADEVPEDIVTFLRFVDADLERSREDFGSDFIARLQSSIDRIKHDREYMRRYNTVNYPDLRLTP